MFNDDNVSVRRAKLFVLFALLFFAGHIVSTGVEAYKCEGMLEKEEAHEEKVKYSGQSYMALGYNFKTGCKIPMYGLEWVVEESNEDYDD